jgi:nucleoside 2-deoxyribosyltransferase
MPRPRCYVASPYGFTEAGRSYYTSVFLPALSAVVEPVDPWSLTDPAEIEAARARGQLRDMMLTIGQRNAEAIRASHMLAAVIDGQEPDSGTASEVGYAAALAKPCYGLRSDLRQSGDEGMRVNLQVEGFIVQSGGRIVGSLAGLVAELQAAAVGLGSDSP